MSQGIGPEKCRVKNAGSGLAITLALGSCNHAGRAFFSKSNYVQLCINANANLSKACVIARLDPAHVHSSGSGLAITHTY